MKLNSNIKISPFSEGINILKAWISVITGKMLSRPISINLLPTMACNSRCVMCDSWKIIEKDPRIDIDVYEKISDEVKSLNIPYITIGGGEPLIFDNIFRVIEIFSKKGISVQLTTNGKAINKEIMQKLVDCGLSRLTFSIDSHIPKTYRDMRGVDWCEEVMIRLKECVKDYSDKLSIETNSVIASINLDSFINTVRTFLDIGVNKICFSAVTISGENYLIGQEKGDLANIDMEKVDVLIKDLLFVKKENPKRISASTYFIRGIKNYFENPRKAVFPCYAGFLTLDILYNGEVYSCGNLPPLGNIRNNKLKDIWFSQEAMKSRLAMASKKCPACYTSCKIELALLASPRKGLFYCFEKLKEAL